MRAYVCADGTTALFARMTTSEPVLREVATVHVADTEFDFFTVCDCADDVVAFGEADADRSGMRHVAALLHNQ